MTKSEALKLALEALEEPKEHFAKHRRLEAITAIKEALAQPEQEPVAWEQFYPDMGKPKLAYLSPTESPDNACYIPPQRTWVGLTDVLDFIEEFTGAERERHPMFSDGYDLALSHVKELVEAKLKEKNT